MIVTSLAWGNYDIRPRAKSHIFVDIEPDEMSHNSILIPEDEDYPRTIAKILEVPKDTSWIDLWSRPGVRVGDRVLFARYSTELLIQHAKWEDIEVVDWTATYTGISVEDATKIQQIFSIKEVHVMDVADIECIIG